MLDKPARGKNTNQNFILNEQNLWKIVSPKEINTQISSKNHFIFNKTVFQLNCHLHWSTEA